MKQRTFALTGRKYLCDSTTISKRSGAARVLCGWLGEMSYRQQETVALNRCPRYIEDA
jgi:hypothetical protein